MNENSRTKNSIINLFGAITNQIVLILLTFISRTIFIRVLGVEYLGLSGLYGNIITIFSLAELGLSTSIVYSLYKPISEKDTEKLNSLVKFYSRIYKYIALSIFIIGLLLIPCLPYIIKTTISFQECFIYYFLFILDTVFSYLFIYKILVLNADQRNYMVTNTNTIIIVLKSILQIIILLCYHNYTLFLVIQILSTLMNNLILSNIADRKYPFLKEKAKPLTEKEKKSITKNIKSQFIYKFSNVLLSGTDNILISILISTECVGYYSNYNVIVATVNTIITILFTSLMGSLGNFIAKESKDKISNLFHIFNFIGNYLAILCNILLLFLLNDFINLWLGQSFVLESKVLIVIVLNFYLGCIIQPITAFRNTTGLFNETKYIMPIAAILNIIFSIILGIVWGLVGIILASFLSRFVTVFWYEPKILFKKYKGIKISTYMLEESKQFLLFIILIGINGILIQNSFSATWLHFILKIVVVFGVTNLIVFILSFKRKEFITLKSIIFRKDVIK